MAPTKKPPDGRVSESAIPPKIPPQTPNTSTNMDKTVEEILTHKLTESQKDVTYHKVQLEKTLQELLEMSYISQNMKDAHTTLINQQKNLEVNYRNIAKKNKTLTEENLSLHSKIADLESKILDLEKQKSPKPKRKTRKVFTTQEQTDTSDAEETTKNLKNSQKPSDDVEMLDEGKLEEKQPQTSQTNAQTTVTKQDPKKHPLYMPESHLSIPTIQKPEQKDSYQIPSIVIHNPKDWAQLYNKITTQKITITKTKKHPLGLAIHVPNAENHRKLTTYLKTQNEEFHTYFLQEDRKLNIIIRGLDRRMSLDAIKKDLDEQGFNPTEVGWLNTGYYRKNQTDLLRMLIPLPYL